jgi:hypothetical protein
MTAVSNVSSFENLPDEFRSLFERAESRSFFFGLPWFRTFAKCALDRGDETRLYTVVASENAREVRIVLPTLRRTADSGFLRARKLHSLSSYYTSLFGPIGTGATSEAALDALSKALAEDSPRWDILDFKPLALDDSCFAALVSGLKSAGFVVQTYFCFGNWYLQINGRSFEQYFESLPSVLRNTLNRKKKKFEKSGRGHLEIVTGGQGLESAIEAYNKVYLSSWKEPEPYPDFVPSLIRECAHRGALRLGILTIDGEPAAAQFWIVQNGAALIYKLAYDQRFGELSVGTILSAALMKHTIDVDRVSEIDYLTGDDSYKKDWMSDRRERWGILAMNPRTLHGSLAIARHVGGRALKRGLQRMVVWGRRKSSQANLEQNLRTQTQI